MEHYLACCTKDCLPYLDGRVSPMLKSAELSLFDPNAVESGIKFESAPVMLPDLQAQLLRYTHVTISLYLDKHMHNIRKYFLEQGEYRFCSNRKLDSYPECILCMQYQLLSTVPRRQRSPLLVLPNVLVSLRVASCVSLLLACGTTPFLFASAPPLASFPPPLPSKQTAQNYASRCSLEGCVLRLFSVYLQSNLRILHQSAKDGIH